MTLNHPGRSLNIERVGQICVVGAGTLGAQIAQVAALHGYRVNLTDLNAVALEKAVEGNRFQLQCRINKGKLSPAEADAALSRVRTFTSLEEAACSADFVIEAVIEDVEVKRELFRKLDAICLPHTILASNSSTIVISQIARDIERKDKAVNMHFFHPALVMQLVEIGRGPETSDETVEVALELGKRIGKETVVMNKEVFGFIVNNALIAEIDAPLNLYADNYARVENVDRTIKPGFNHSHGSFELTDFSEVEVIHSVRQPHYNETDDPRDKPPTFLEDMVSEGRLGRKAGRSFYDYNAPKSR